MSEHELYHQSFKTGYWAREEASECPCLGLGWALSEADAWYKCPVHFDGQPHPECDFPSDEELPPFVPPPEPEVSDLPF